MVSLLPDGRLGAVTDTVVRHGSGPTNRQFTSHPHGSAFDPTGRYLATVDLGTDTLEVFQLVAGVMQSRQVVHIAAGAGPRHVLFRPDGSAVYVLNELNSSISVFAFDEGTGSVGSLLQTIDTVPAGFPANRSSAELLIDPTGQFLYASNRRFVDHPQADSIAEFRIGPTGRLTSLGWFTAGIATPRTMSFDPQGRWLYVLNQDGASIEQLVVDPTTGLLSATGRVTSLTEPVGIAFATP